MGPMHLVVVFGDKVSDACCLCNMCADVANNDIDSEVEYPTAVGHVG